MTALSKQLDNKYIDLLFLFFQYSASSRDSVNIKIYICIKIHKNILDFYMLLSIRNHYLKIKF